MLTNDSKGTVLSAGTGRVDLFVKQHSSLPMFGVELKVAHTSPCPQPTTAHLHQAERYSLALGQTREGVEVAKIPVFAVVLAPKVGATVQMVVR